MSGQAEFLKSHFPIWNYPNAILKIRFPTQNTHGHFPTAQEFMVREVEILESQLAGQFSI